MMPRSGMGRDTAISPVASNVSVGRIARHEWIIRFGLTSIIANGRSDISSSPCIEMCGHVTWVLVQCRGPRDSSKERTLSHLNSPALGESEGKTLAIVPVE